MSLLFPTLPKQPGLTMRYSALLYTLIHLLLEIGNRGPRLGPWDKVPRSFSYVPLFFWGRNYAASRRTAGIYTHTHTGHLNGSKGRHIRPYSNFTVIYNQVEAWYEWQIGQDRQSGHPRTGVLEQRPNGIFPPLM